MIFRAIPLAIAITIAIVFVGGEGLKALGHAPATALG